MSIDASAPPLAEALRSLQSPSDPTSWIILHYSPPQSTTISLHSSGPDPSLHHVRSTIEQSSPMDDVMFAYALIGGKGLIVVFLKDSVGGVRRARAIVHSRAMVALFPEYFALVTIAHPSQLTQELVHERLALDNPLPPFHTSTSTSATQVQTHLPNTNPAPLDSHLPPSPPLASASVSVPLAQPLDIAATQPTPSLSQPQPEQDSAHSHSGEVVNAAKVGGGDEEHNPSLTPPPTRVSKLPSSVSGQFADPGLEPVELKRPNHSQPSTYDALLTNSVFQDGYENNHPVFKEGHNQRTGLSHVQVASNDPTVNCIDNLTSGSGSTSGPLAAAAGLGLGVGVEERKRPGQAFAKLNPFRSISAAHNTSSQNQPEAARSVSLNSPTPNSPDIERPFVPIPLPVPSHQSSRGPSEGIDVRSSGDEPVVGGTKSLPSATTLNSPASPAGTSRFKPSSIASAFRRKKRVSASSIEPNSGPSSPHAGEFGASSSGSREDPAPPPLPPKEYPSQLHPHPIQPSLQQDQSHSLAPSPLSPTISMIDESSSPEIDGYVADISPNELIHTSTGGIGYNADPESTSRSNSASVFAEKFIGSVTDGRSGSGNLESLTNRVDLKPSPSASEALFKARQKSLYAENEMHEKFRRVEEERARARAVVVDEGRLNGSEMVFRGDEVGESGLAYLREVEGEGKDKVVEKSAKLDGSRNKVGNASFALDSAVAKGGERGLGEVEKSETGTFTGTTAAPSLPLSRSAEIMAAVAATTFPNPPNKVESTLETIEANKLGIDGSALPDEVPGVAGPTAVAGGTVLVNGAEPTSDQRNVLQPPELQPIDSSANVENVMNEASKKVVEVVVNDGKVNEAVQSVPLNASTVDDHIPPFDETVPVESTQTLAPVIVSPSALEVHKPTEEERLELARHQQEVALAELAKMKLEEQQRKEAAEEKIKEESRIRREAIKEGLKRSKQGGGVMLTGVSYCGKEEIEQIRETGERWTTVQTSRSATWRRRWFKLFPTELHLFKSDLDENKSLAVIRLPGSTLSETYEESQVKGSFKLTTNEEEYYMFADSAEDKETILEGLGLCLG